MLFVSLLVITGLYLTLSRGAGLALFIAVLFLAVSKRDKLIIGALIVSIIIFPFVAPKNMKSWLSIAREHPVVFMCSPVRISFYKNTCNMIYHHPIIGVGVNTFSKRYGEYRLPEVEKAAASESTTYCHNNFLQMAGEIGLVGLAAFLWFLFVLFRKNIESFKRFKDEYLKIISLSLIACFIAFLVNGLTETSLYYARVAMIFWFLVGFSLAVSRMRETGRY
jgi:O-antigen ligase